MEELDVGFEEDCVRLGEDLLVERELVLLLDYNENIKDITYFSSKKIKTHLDL